jgi:hypothetical protein
MEFSSNHDFDRDIRKQPKMGDVCSLFFMLFSILGDLSDVEHAYSVMIKLSLLF